MVAMPSPSPAVTISPGLTALTPAGVPIPVAAWLISLRGPLALVHKRFAFLQ